MVLPTKKMFSGATPARCRFSPAEVEVVKNQFVMESVTTRLISSGIVQSPERRPPSTCATGTPSFLAAMAQAIVDVTSPTTTQASARRPRSTRS
jgi:hypothetical protein